MKRCILVSVRPQKDRETNDDLLFLTLYRLPNKMKNGGLWHPKKDETIINACINAKNKPEDFKFWSSTKTASTPKPLGACPSGLGKRCKKVQKRANVIQN